MTQAFPIPGFGWGDGNKVPSQPGMTKLEYAALHIYCTQMETEPLDDAMESEGIDRETLMARYAVSQAKKLLEEASK